MRRDAPTTASTRVYSPARPGVALYRSIAIFVALTILLLAGRSVVPSYMRAQKNTIVDSAYRHSIPPEVLGAVFYNEMLGQETRFLSTIIPGSSRLAQNLRDGLIGLHFLTLKQGQWGLKGLLGLVGFNTTVGPTGIRPSVGREIQGEISVAGGRYRSHGLAERPTLILDLINPPTAIEYLAANLERGARRAAGEAEVDPASAWRALARWHNTGLTAYRPGLSRAVWEKGSRYVSRVQEFLPAVSAFLDAPVQPRPDAFALLTAWLASSTAGHGPASDGATKHVQPAIIIMGAQ